MLIDVKNLFKIYHEGEESEVRALDGVSLSVDRGEFLAIIGQSVRSFGFIDLRSSCLQAALRLFSSISFVASPLCFWYR